MPLPQPLLIARKDLRHLWPETLLVLVLFVAFAWAAPSGWTVSQYSSFAPILAGLLKLLMPISWLILISRLIHDEPLVGDRQFWTSRPYHWAKLLAAKLLFLGVFLYLPFLFMQVFLLLRAGLHPTTTLGPLSFNLLLLTVLVVVPITALAAVTATFARLLLSALGAVVYVAVVALSIAYLGFERMPPPALGPVLIVIVVALPAAALVYQYATRRTSVARILLLATPLLVALLLVLTPASALIRHAYPQADASAPTLSPVPAQIVPHTPQPGRLATFRNQAELSLPFSVAGADRDSNYLLQGAELTVTSGSARYTTPFLTVAGQVSAGSPLTLVTIPLPLDIFNKIRSTPTDIHLSLAAEHIKAEAPQEWKATLAPFSVPGNGICSYAEQDPDLPPTCRYPFKVPQLNLVSAPLAASSCSTPNGPPIPGAAALNGTLGLLDFDPVITNRLALHPEHTAPGVEYLLCPGTTLTFIEAKDVGKVRLEASDKQLLLENYAIHEGVQTAPTQPLPQPAEQ